VTFCEVEGDTSSVLNSFADQSISTRKQQSFLDACRVIADDIHNQPHVLGIFYFTAHVDHTLPSADHLTNNYTYRSFLQTTAFSLKSTLLISNSWMDTIFRHSTLLFIFLLSRVILCYVGLCCLKLSRVSVDKCVSQHAVRFYES